MLRSFGFIGLYVEPCIKLAPIKCKLPILSQPCVYFKDASLPASNNVITWRLRQRGNGCNTFFSDSRPLIRPPASLSRQRPGTGKSGLQHCILTQKANAINSVVSGWEALVECGVILTISMKPGFCKRVNIVLGTEI